jgi:hypothetical protein
LNVDATSGGLLFVHYEVQMSGRRSDPRFLVASPWDGAIHVLRDVMVNRVHPSELVAISIAPGVIGEEMSLDLMTEGSNLAVRVQVLESRPVVVDGAMRHEIRLGVESVAVTGAWRPEAV